ncbi:hypothetical protein [Pseudarthrobacter sp. B4EP4b]|uniref:hypothetical protein n=1 Tax=Pseudarthrobacter sp. B4EP4b TaxID=2590664 RepID=UPI0015EE6A83|nr:hypothetical protein [Pseudarthrobacter sp. B4EP4b]
MRGFAKLSSLFSLLALLSALFSRIDLPAFLAAPLLGDFPDIGITPFFACVTQYHTYFYFLSQSCETGATPQQRSRSPRLSRGFGLFQFDQEAFLIFFQGMRPTVESN